ncbi:MAG TPA: AI-2E family transporter [Chitinophagaceae bacterium]|nr:AI-2E family transporter [Chitinophagaceae bacterium]
MNISNSTTQPFYFKLAMVLIAILALGYISILTKEVLSPLLFGLLFSILLLPLSVYFEKKLKFRRSASSALSVLLLIVALAAVLFLIGSQITNLAQDLPLLKEQVIMSLHNFQEWISDKFDVNMQKQMNYVNKAATKIQTATPSMIGSTVLSLSSILLFLVFVILYTFFMLFYRRRLLKFLVDVFKEENKAIVYDIVATVQDILRKYVVGLFLEMSTVAVVCCSVFLLLGIKYAILLGLITALFNIVPYIGIFSALLLNVIITFATTGMAGTVLLVVITVVAMHLIDSNILLPMIVGSKVRINAFVTLLGVVLGEMIWGISGMFLSIPVIAMAKIIFDRVESMKPWGVLLGDEKIEARTLNINLKKRNPKVI